MSLVEMRRRSVRLGSSHVAVVYPQFLDSWFAGEVEPRVEEAAPRKWVDLVTRENSDCFDVAASAGAPALGVDLGAALALFWERVSFLLIDDLADAMALHAAALKREDGMVLLPGLTGCGKTRLGLWYRARGFDLETDEIVTIAPKPGDSGSAFSFAALRRPVMVKGTIDRAAILRRGEAPRAQQESAYGLLMRLIDDAPAPSGTMDRGLIVFPRFASGATFKLTPLSPGETGLGLVGNCLNARNLARGGLAIARQLAARMRAVTLDYGDSEQLEETLDVLTRQALAAPIGEADFASLCAAFTARARGRTTQEEQSERTAATSVEPGHPVPAPTVQRFPRRLSVGMATYDDYDGVYFTIQSLRANHPELAGELEFIVIDNHPGGPCSQALGELGKSIDGCRYVPRGEWAGTAMKNAVFEEASSPFVLCVDSHVLVAPGALTKLIAFFESNPDSRDLLQGPLVYDDLTNVSTHMDPQWRGGMFGTWANDPRGRDSSAPAFEIPMHGMGLFAMRRPAWPGFNPMFRGFGAEEGYIHEKVRQRGGRTLCLPFLRWLHRFNRPFGLSYVNRWEDRMRNYLIGFTELGLDTAAMEAHFADLLGAETAARIFSDIRRELQPRPEPLPAH